MISDITGADIAYLPNPRVEAEENELIVRNDQFLALGLEPTTLSEGLLGEVKEIATKYAGRADPRSRSPMTSRLSSGGFLSARPTELSARPTELCLEIARRGYAEPDDDGPGAAKARRVPAEQVGDAPDHAEGKGPDGV